MGVANIMESEGANLNRRLPGETPLNDISGLKLKWITTVQALSKVEFENIEKALDKYTSRKPTNKTAPFTARWMCKVHREMFGEVWRWAGSPRKGDLNIGLPWYQVEIAIEDLSRDIAKWKTSSDFDLISQAATIHFRAVQIHPFLNGNGRWSRLLANIWLCKHSAKLTQWPEHGLVRHESPIRDEYIQALKQADKGHIDPLVDLHRKYSR